MLTNKNKSTILLFLVNRREWMVHVEPAGVEMKSDFVLWLICIQVTGASERWKWNFKRFCINGIFNLSPLGALDMPKGHNISPAPATCKCHLLIWCPADRGRKMNDEWWVINDDGGLFRLSFKCCHHLYRLLFVWISKNYSNKKQKLKRNRSLKMCFVGFIKL